MRSKHGREGHAITVQRVCDILRGAAVYITLKYATNDLGLSFDDHTASWPT